MKKTQYWLRKKATISGDSAMVRDESGQSLIELALGLTFLVVMIGGVAEFGSLAYSAIEISDAAHAGAQYGSQNHATASDTSGMQVAATEDAPNVSGISATASHGCVCSDGTSSTCSATDCSTSRLIETVTVNTTANVSPKFVVPGLPKTYTINGSATMRVIQ